MGSWRRKKSILEKGRENGGKVERQENEKHEDQSRKHEGEVRKETR